MKKFKIIVVAVCSLALLTACGNNKEYETTKYKPADNDAKNISKTIWLSAVPKGFQAYLNDKKIVADLSSKEPLQVTVPKEVRENKDKIVYKDTIPLLNEVTIKNSDDSVKGSPKDKDLADFYVQTIKDYFSAGATRDFSKIKNYTNHFYEENKDYIERSSFLEENMYDMTLTKILAYNKPVNLHVDKGTLYLDLTGYINYLYSPSYSENGFLSDDVPVKLTFIYNSDKKAWLLDQMDNMFIIHDKEELPDPDSSNKLMVEGNL